MSGTLRKMRRLALAEFRADHTAEPSARLNSWATRHNARLAQLGGGFDDQRAGVLVPLSSITRRREIVQLADDAIMAVEYVRRMFIRGPQTQPWPAAADPDAP